MTDASGGAGALYVGVMSGTSLDGVTAAVVRITGGDTVAHELIGVTTREYTAPQRERLLAAMQQGTAEEYCRLGFDVGAWLAAAAVAAIADAGVARGEVRAIASHGQTLWHVPAQATWQIGESAVIAERTGVDVVSDFRVRDVAAGGHGAPLVPIADALLYASTTEWRLLQNLGGMANVTVVPPGGGGAQQRGVRAFDTGPGVALIDAVVRALYPGATYDVDGRIAETGSADDTVVAELLRDPYFAQSPPKSTGREHFGTAYAERLMELCRARGSSNHSTSHRGTSDADVVATAVAFTAASIADAYRRFVPEPVTEVIVSGGGAKHPVLLRALRHALAPREVRPFDAVYYDGAAKEAVAFALLAHLHLARTPGNVVGATGACGPRVLGKLTPA